MSSRFFRFAYTNPPGEGRPRLHHSRDGAAFDELIDPLYSRDYRHGTFIHNYPRHRQHSREFEFIQPGDLVVTTTRPPLDDVLEKGDKDRRHIDRSEDALEKAIHKELRRFFTHLSRYCIILTPEMAALLPPEYASLAKINFHTRGKATILNTEVTVGGRTRTRAAPKGFNAIGIFIHLAKVNAFPCGLIASFSMGGYENLLWNRIVRLRYRKWFERPSFALALLNLPDEPPQPLTPMLADDARTKVVIAKHITSEPRRECRLTTLNSSAVPSKSKSGDRSQSKRRPLPAKDQDDSFII